MLRTFLRGAMVLATLASVLLPVAPAAAAVGSYTLSSSPVTINRDGRTYQLTITASQGEGGDSGTVSISKVSNPAGVAYARQDHQYSWTFAGNRFVPTSNLASATLKTSGEMGSFGTLDLTFTQNGAVQNLCNTTVKKRPGTLAGSVTFNTGTPLFGTIRAVPSGATLIYNSTGACTDSGHNYNACPPPGFDVSGYRFPSNGLFYVSASKANSETGPGRISFMRSAAMPPESTNAPGSVYRMVTAEVPRSDVTIAANLSSATISGEAGTWISGSATFASNGPVGTAYEDPCAGGRKSVYTSRPGALSGSLNADVFVGPNLLVGENMPGGAGKTNVRAQ